MSTSKKDTKASVKITDLKPTKSVKGGFKVMDVMKSHSPR